MDAHRQALAEAGLSIKTKPITAQGLVPYGRTVVPGGVTVHIRLKPSTGTSWLHGIPAFGHLLKSNTTESNGHELFFFATPKILTS